MGLLGGIISNAIGGAGQAGQAALASQQASGQQLSNAEDLEKLRADLEVQKNLSITQNQQALKLGLLDKLYPQAPQPPAAPTGQAPIASSASTPDAVTNTSPSSSTTLLPPPNTAGNSPSWQIAPSFQNAADLQSLAIMQNEMKEDGDPNNKAAAQREIDRLKAKIAANGGANTPSNAAAPDTPSAPTAPMSVPSAVSGLGRTSGPAIWQPTRDQMAAAYKADLLVPGSGAKLLEQGAPDATGKMLLAQGIQPGSQEWNEGYKAALLKSTSENLREGNFQVNNGKVVISAPKDGVQQIQNPDGSFSAAPVSNYGETKGAIKANEMAGTNSQTIAPLDARPVDKYGRPIPVSVSSALNSGQGAGNEPGLVTGKEGQQTALSQKWKDLNAQNQQAQTSTSYLQNIKSLASKAAVGPASDKVDFANGLLSLAGSQKATDAVTANDLLDKYSNQIVSRLGQGGMGTDAARQILASAYPSAHMNLPAINEAVDNIVGANDMVKAKAALLAPHAANLDPVTYQQKELVFDQNADPRIWQWKNIQDPNQRKAFAQSVVAQDPHFLSKIQALEQIGVH